MSLFDAFFMGWQQDVKLAILPPLACALFRLAFITYFGPKKLTRWGKAKLYHCFRYGFWWGMDFNAYAYLVPLVLVTIPGVVLPWYFDLGNTIRLVLITVYLVVLYVLFWTKMIFYYHYHDIINNNILFGKNADKGNLADIFFNQNRGGWILLSFIPYIALCWYAGGLLLGISAVPFIELDNAYLQYSANTLVFLFSIAMFYWFRFGGTFRHRNKPEWDEVPMIVKEDVFLGKATVDDLVALEIVLKHPAPEFVSKNDEEAIKSIQKICPEFSGGRDNPLFHFRHMAKGARIKKPRHIFFLLGESQCQTPFDSIYDNLHLMDASKKFQQEPGTVTIANFQPAGMISQTALGSILLGLYDCDLELNEKKGIWSCDISKIPTSLAGQLKRLGYHTSFWYGGSLNWGSLVHFIPAVGFDEAHGGPDFCPPGSPQTWLGVYDHIFLDSVAEHIKSNPQEELQFHFIYTTSNHGPYNLPYHEYGLDIDRLMPEMPDSLRRDTVEARRFMGVCYADRCLMEFVKRMKNEYSDSLFIITGDHSAAVLPFGKGILPRSEATVRENMLTAFYMHHADLTWDMLNNNVLGEHQNILPTIMELIAPQGFEYYSLKSSLTESIDHVVTPYSWMNRLEIGYYKDKIRQQLMESAESVATDHGVEDYLEEKNSLQDVTGWLVRHMEIIQ